jgi:hypothetical protein
LIQQQEQFTEERAGHLAPFQHFNVQPRAV